MKAGLLGRDAVRSFGCRLAVVIATAWLPAAACLAQGAAPRSVSPEAAGGAAPAGAAGANAFDPNLPSLGATFAPLPAGAGKQVADLSCQKCHSSDIIRQQRLQSKQWAAVVDKMIRWGAQVPDEHKAELVDYLATDFGPTNDRFAPIVTRPVGD